MLRRTTPYFCLMLILSGSLTAQNKAMDTLSMQNTTVEHHRMTWAPVDHIDSFSQSLASGASVAALLQQRTSFYFKDYGPTLATPSLRGMSASQTKIYLESLPIISATLGTYDVSLLPAALYDVSVLYGSESMRLGPGGFGGAIALERKPILWTPKTSATIRYGYNTLNNNQIDGELLLGSKRLRSATSFLINDYRNQYTYKDILSYGAPEVVQQHARSSQLNLAQTFDYRLRKHQTLSLFAQIQQTSRDIPPPLTVAHNAEDKSDSSLRIMLLHNYTPDSGKVSFLKSSLGFSREALRYTNHLAAIRSVINVDKYFAQTQLEFNFSKLRSSTTLRHTSDIAGSPGFTDLKYQHRTMIIQHLSWQYARNKVLEANIIEEVSNGHLINPARSLAQESRIRLGSKFNLINRLGYLINYNLPSLNDLYWYQGGNPNLLPERLHGAESNIALENRTEHILEFRAWLYRVQNWILWLPVNGGFFAPQNIAQVRSGGIELKAAKQFRIHNRSVLRPEILLTVQRAEQISPSLKQWTQLPYTPLSSMKLNVSYEWKRFYSLLNISYTDIRYTQTDQTEPLSSYTLIGLSTGYKFNRHLNISLEGQNLGNSHYQTVAYYPMPGRYFGAKVSLGTN